MEWEQAFGISRSFCGLTEALSFRLSGRGEATHDTPDAAQTRNTAKMGPSPNSAVAEATRSSPPAPRTRGSATPGYQVLGAPIAAVLTQLQNATTAPNDQRHKQTDDAARPGISNSTTPV
jgi:hypothetical protein